MKRISFDFELKQVPVAVFFMISTPILLWGSILGYGSHYMGIIDPFLQWYVWFMMYGTIPVVVYIIFFTKFNNPFRKQEVIT